MAPGREAAGAVSNEFEFERARSIIPAASTRRCGRSARWAARRASSPPRTGPTSSTSRAASTSTSSARGVRRCSATRPPRSSSPCRRPRPTASLRCLDAGGDGPRRAHPRAHHGRGLGDARPDPARLDRHRGDDDGDQARARGDGPRPRRQVRGHYHGHSDGLLASPARGVATLGLPGSAGVPAEIAALTLVLPYNDLDACGSRSTLIRAVSPRSSLRRRGRTPGCSPPTRASTSRCSRSPTRTMRCSSSTRCSPASASARPAGGGSRSPEGCPAARAGSPTLATFGKVIGGGLPLAAVAGRADVHAAARPERPGLPGGDPLRESARGRRRPRAASARRISPPTRRSTPPPHGSHRPWSRRSRRAASRSPSRGRGASSRSRSATRPSGGSATTPTRRTRRPALRRVLRLDARPGRLAPAERLRGVVPLGVARARGARPNRGGTAGRGGGRGCRHPRFQE